MTESFGETTTPTLKTFEDKALERADVREVCDELAPAYALRRKLVAIRHQAGLIQEEVAQRLHTSKSNISRLESVGSKISPKLSTIEEYARAVGYELKIDLVPEKRAR